METPLFFRDLPVGAVFEFAIMVKATRKRYVKTSPRKYRTMIHQGKWEDFHVTDMGASVERHPEDE